MIDYDLHTGNVLGLTGKIMAFLASLVAASLPITGLVVWLGKGRSKWQAGISYVLPAPVYILNKCVVVEEYPAIKTVL